MSCQGRIRSGDHGSTPRKYFHVMTILETLLGYTSIPKCVHRYTRATRCFTSKMIFMYHVTCICWDLSCRNFPNRRRRLSLCYTMACLKGPGAKAPNSVSSRDDGSIGGFKVKGKRERLRDRGSTQTWNQPTEYYYLVPLLTLNSSVHH